MSLPYFFVEKLVPETQNMILNEEQSKHVIQVLRMQKGAAILLTDGKGSKVLAHIIDDHRKRCEVKIISIDKTQEPRSKILIAVSLIKNAARFEWFLEKATEIGINEIVPIICERTEREKVRLDRMENILVSAMLQSQQCWLPILHEPVDFRKLVEETYEGQKFIAHCLPNQKQQLASLLHQTAFTNRNSSLLLIGPEGDFTESEIQLALSKNFQPVALGNTRLRTETAGIFAAVLLKNFI